MKILFWMLKLIAFAAAGAVGLLVLAVVFMQTDYARGKLVSFARDQIRASTRADIRIGRVRGDLLTGITLENAGFDVENEELFFARRIRVDYFLPALLHNAVVADRVTIEGMRGTLRREAGGKWNVERIAPPSGDKKKKRLAGGGRPWSVTVRQVTIRDATIESIDAAGGGGRRLEKYSLAGQFNLRRRNGQDVISIGVNRLSLRSTRPALEIAQLSGAVTIAGPLITFDDIRLETKGSRVRVSGSVRTGRYAAYDVRAGFPRISFDDIRAFVPGVRLPGAFSSFVSIRGPANAVRVRHRLQYRDLTLDSDALVNVQEPAVTLQSAVRHLKPAELVPHCGAGIPKEGCPSGDISFDLAGELCGSPAQPRHAALDLRVLPSVLNSVTINGANLVLLLDGKRLTISSGTVVSSAGTLRITGGGAILGLFRPEKDLDARLSVSVQHADLGAFSGRPPLKSDLNLTLAAAAAKPAGKRLTDGLTAEVTMRAGPSQLYGIAVTSAAVRAGYRPRALTIAECRVASDLVHADVSGSIDQDGPIALHFAVASDNLAAVGRVIPGFAARGKLRVRGTAGGTVREPSVSGEASGEMLGYGTLSAGGLAAQLSARLSSGTVAGNAAVTLREIASGDTALGTLRAAARGAIADFGFDVNLQRDALRHYMMNGTVTERGAVRTVRLDTFALAAGTVAWVNDGPLEADIASSGVTVRRFALVHGEQMVRCSGRLGMQGPVVFDLSVSSAAIGEAAWIAGTDAGVGGRISGTVGIRGDARAPEADGRIRVDELRLGGVSFDALTLVAGYRGRLLRVKAALDGQQRRLMTVEGVVPVDAAPQAAGERLGADGLDIRLQALHVNPRFLTGITRAVEKADGDITLDLRARGDPVRPELDGTLQIDNAMVRIAALGTDYREINGRISLASGTATVERFTVRSGDGRAQLDGSLSLRGVTPYGARLTLACRKFRVMDTALFSGTVDADARLEGTKDAATLTGTVTVLESNVYIPSQGRKQVREIEFVEAPGAGGGQVRAGKGKPQPLTGNLVIDTVVNVPGNTWIKGQGVNAEVQGKVRYRQDRGAPAYLTGQLQTVRGTYELRGRLLKIDRGVVIFTGERRLNANLDIMATGMVSNVQIIVLIGGTLDKPVITLKSDPAMDESQILSYLIFGKPAERLNEQENRLVQSTAIQVLGGIAARGLKDVLGRQYAPDVINITSTGGESSFAVGKYLTEKLFVRYEWRLGTEEVTQTIVDYRLSTHFDLRSQFGTERNSGVDILWSVNY